MIEKSFHNSKTFLSVSENKIGKQVVMFSTCFHAFSFHYKQIRPVTFIATSHDPTGLKLLA